VERRGLYRSHAAKIAIVDVCELHSLGNASGLGSPDILTTLRRQKKQRAPPMSGLVVAARHAFAARQAIEAGRGGFEGLPT
jgi:hypothetical protein